MKLQFLKWP